MQNKCWTWRIRKVTKFNMFFLYLGLWSLYSGSRIESSLGVRKAHYTYYYVQKSFIFLARTGIRKISSVACEFCPVKINFSDYQKSFVSRINEFTYFSIRYRYSDILLKNINFIYNRLLCCNHTFYCVGMVSVTSASRYVTSTSRSPSRYSM